MGTRTLGGEREARLPADEHGPRRAGQRGPREGGLAMVVDSALISLLFGGRPIKSSTRLG
jgi:hypothetical protein